MDAIEALRQSIRTQLDPARRNGIAELAIGMAEAAARELVPFIGNAGFCIIFSRSVHQARSRYPWLKQRSPPASPGDLIAVLRDSADGRAPIEIAFAGRHVFLGMIDSLAILLGEQMTSTLLHAAWGEDAPALPSASASQPAGAGRPERRLEERRAGGARERSAMRRGRIGQKRAEQRAMLEQRLQRLWQVNEKLVQSCFEAEAGKVTAQQANEQMGHLAYHDFLTDLPNRMLLNDRIAQATLLAERDGSNFALFFLDLDNFKHVNDALGHGTGDRLLQSIARRLTACVRASDTVSRQGGDEFVLLVPDGAQAAAAAQLAEKILQALAAPHMILGHELYITCSIGISLCPFDGLDTEALLKNADTAMYQAKSAGRNNYQFFTPAMNTRAVERQAIESSLRHALLRGELELYYQPKVDLRSGRICGAEALMRWNHPEWGLLMPDRFIPIAEEFGLIVNMGRWVLLTACMQAQQWKSERAAWVDVAVNVSTLEFCHPEFLANVREVLAQSGLPARHLQLEITESVLMRDAASCAETLRQLKLMGVTLALDDFGTGYSSLSYLNFLPIDVVKIDRSFVQSINGPQEGSMLAGAVIAMGQSLGKTIVAEGVELESELAYLQTMRCEAVQGFLFSHPLQAEQFSNLLKREQASMAAMNFSNWKV
ncbi:putative bifunctional diguanylate cyclase/phosphodiesterase [Pseudoduganella aquatica]|uniref:putative bifunctional diguanylate cyclase/phosphodiesterase n=1 Tax=Pseudoduganella aquatica TaxID=2660641 RepID=UPI001E2FCC4C|nr:EAL domain-containing protein [Pseudoduganella aquatica]